MTFTTLSDIRVLTGFINFLNNSHLEDFNKEGMDNCMFWKDHFPHRNVPENEMSAKC